jgi:hypothetical protein
VLIALLSGCDPAENIYVERLSGQPVLCEGGKQTSAGVWYVVTHPDKRDEPLYEERHRFTIEPRGGALSANPDSLSAGIIAGSIESGRVPWIQFTVYCGDSAEPLLVTPRITKKDLKKADDGYLYIVE